MHFARIFLAQGRFVERARFIGFPLTNRFIGRLLAFSLGCE